LAINNWQSTKKLKIICQCLLSNAHCLLPIANCFAPVE
jgi:hypothetical protein